MVDYRRIIDKYIDPSTELHKIYYRHVEQVTEKALEVACALDLCDTKREFIEEASMLHDIGVVKVDLPLIHCYGDKPYLYHHILGYRMLMDEGLPRHARVASSHFTPGTTSEDIRRMGLHYDKPDVDFFHRCIEEVIIGYADMFSTKDPSEGGRMRRVEEVLSNAPKYGNHIYETVFDLSIEYGQLSIGEL